MKLGLGTLVATLRACPHQGLHQGLHKGTLPSCAAVCSILNNRSEGCSSQQLRILFLISPSLFSQARVHSIKDCSSSQMGTKDKAMALHRLSLACMCITLFGAQGIGAYNTTVEVDGEQRVVCFLDTPGHEAFSAMRARGALVSVLMT
jgi:hypothetical protein